MSKTTRAGLFALVAVLLICGLPFLTRLWFGTHEIVNRQPPPAASPAPATATAVLTAPPDLEKGDADQARRKRLQAENRQLRLANATLDEASQKAEADKKRAEKTAQTMAEFSGKLLDPNLKVPQTVSEAASLMGQNLADAAKFKQKWGDSVPAAGTPEADEYAKEQDALVTQSAAMMKFVTDEKNATFLGQPGGIAQFQAASLVGAIGLRDDQVQAVDATLDEYYQQFFAQGLNSDARPQTRDSTRGTSKDSRP